MYTLKDFDADVDKIYRIEAFSRLWGDYGNILANGMVGHRENDTLQLMRTGPYIPPISFPGVSEIVVTEEMKEVMQNAEFKGIEFKAVEKKRIVKLEWEKWDKNAYEPEILPKEGSPANYILGKRHSEEVSKRLGNLWEVVYSEGAQVSKIKTGSNFWEEDFHYHPNSWNGADIFSASGYGFILCSHRAKQWLESLYQSYVSISSFPVLGANPFRFWE